MSYTHARYNRTVYAGTRGDCTTKDYLSAAPDLYWPQTLACFDRISSIILFKRTRPIRTATHSPVMRRETRTSSTQLIAHPALVGMYYLARCLSMPDRDEGGSKTTRKRLRNMHAHPSRGVKGTRQLTRVAKSP